MQDDKFGRRCVGSNINWCNPHDSSWALFRDVISSHHHDPDLALKSRSITKSDDFKWMI